MDFQASNFVDNVINDEPDGSGGGKGAGKSGGGTEAPNTLRSKAIGRFLYLLGEGEIIGLVDNAKSIILNKVPYENSDGSTNYNGLQWGLKTGTPDQTALPGFENVTTEYEVNLRVKTTTPVTYRTQSADLDAITVTLNIPALSILDDKKGELKGYHFDIAIDVKNISNPANAWVEKVRDYQTGKNTSPYERSYRIDVEGPGPWLVRMRRLSPDNDNNSKISDQTYFSHVTEISDFSVAYADSAIIGVEIDVEQLGNSADLRFDLKGKKINYPSNFDPVTRTFTGFWNGTFSFGWCNDPAWVMMDVLLNPRYGIALPMSLIDKWGLYQLSKFCSAMVSDGEGGMEPRFAFNGTFYNQEQAYKTIQAIASMMRAIVFYGAGALIIRHDAPMAPEQRVYAPANVVGDFSYSSTAKGVRRNACIVQWTNPALGYEADYEVYEDREAIIKHGYNPISIRAVGTTSRGQAYRQAKWFVLTEQMQTDTITFEAGLDSAGVLPGDIIEVADPHWATADFGGRLIQPETRNLLPVSQTSVSAWGLTGATKVLEYKPSSWANGGLVKLVAAASLNQHNARITTAILNIPSSNYTYSVEVDASDYKYFMLNYMRGSVVISASFDLDRETVRAKANSLIRNAGIQKLGGTRYRIWMSLQSFTDTVAPTLYVGFDNPSAPAFNLSTGALTTWTPLGTETAWFGAPQFELSSVPTPSAPPRADGVTQFYLDRAIDYAGSTAPQLHMTLLAGIPDDIANVDNTDRPIKREIRYFSSNILAYNSELNMVTLQTPVPAGGDDDITPLVWIFSKAQQVPRAYKVISNEENTDENTFGLTGLQYEPQKFVRMDEGFVINYDPGANYSNLPVTNYCAPPSRLRVEASLLNGRRRLNVSWDASPDQFLRGYLVSYKIDDENWIELPMQFHNYYELDAELGNYFFAVRAVNRFGVPSTPITQGLGLNESDPSTQNGVIDIFTEQGDNTFIDRDIRLFWTSNPLSANPQTPAFRAEVAKPALTVTNVGGELTVQGGVGTVSSAAIVANVSNIDAPTVTTSGTFDKGDTARVYIGQSLFTYTVIAATENSAYVAAQLSAQIHADARFNATVVGSVITVVFANGATNASELTAVDDPAFRRFRVRVLDATTSVEKRVEYPTVPEFTYSFAANVQDFGTPSRSVKFAISVEDINGVLSQESIIVMTNPLPIPPLVTVDTLPGAVTFRYTPPSDPDFAGIILYVSAVNGFVPGPGNLVYHDRGSPTIPIATPGTYYYKYGFFDSFGDAGVALSTQGSFVIVSADLDAPTLAAPGWDVVPLASATTIDPLTGQPLTTLTIDWSAGTNGAAQISQYEVEVRETSTGNWLGGYMTGGDITTLRLRDVAPNKYYQARVRAFNILGAPGPYNTIMPADPGHLTAKDNVAPGVPTTVSGTAAFRTVFLQWTNTNAAADTDLAAVEVWENTVNNSATATRIDVVNAIKGQPGSYTRSGLSSNAMRYYWLKSVDNSGNVSGFHAAPTTGVAVTPAFVPAIDISGTLSDAQIASLAAGKITGTLTDAQISAIAAAKLTGQIVSTQITDDAVTTAKIAANAITAAEIAADTITAAQIAASAITATELAAGAVIAGKIAAGTIVAADIAANTITAAKIAALTITSNEIAADAITANKILAGTITSDRILAGTLTGDRFNTSTSLPGTITVGLTGVSLGTVQSQANDPAARVNANSTVIDPGKILISGAITLANWRNGTDSTKIEGGSVAANTISANKLKIGLRNINVLNCDFQWNGTALVWTTGYVLYTDDAGTQTSVVIAAGSYTWPGTFGYVYWNKGSGVFNTSTDWVAIRNNGDNVLMCTWGGGSKFIPNYGGTIIDGDRITTNSILANKLNVLSLDAITANIGLLRTATSGARMELESNQMRVYDANRLRVRLGLW